MPSQKGPRDTGIPDDPAGQEKAEGSRDNVDVEGGISNRPIEEEQRDQQDLPPRGESRRGSHA
jgi:hypothetical protein